MADMALIIKIPEHYYNNNIKRDLPVYLSEDNVVAILPKNPTNGDMIKAMFPDAEIRFTVNLSDMHAVHVKFGDNTYICYDNHLFSREWWNAPYKRGE